MHKRTDQRVPARLHRLEQRFVAWRSTRSKGERIPQSLWNAAAKLALELGICRTAKLLKLDYYSLKKHVDAQSDSSRKTTSKSTSQNTFLELPAPPATLVNECVIELEDGSGACMRMHLKGAEFPDVLALGRSFWSTD